MTKDDILTVAWEAGFDNASGIYYGELERFAAIVAAHVTEALTKSHEAAFQSYVDQAKADRELGALAARLDEREKLSKIVLDDTYAMTFQTFGQYRTAIAKFIRESK